jgi:SAM-dependent methyltransferase
VGLEGAAVEPGTVEELAARMGLEAGRALVPLGWMLRKLAARRAVEETAPGDGERRYRMRGRLPVQDPAELEEAQRDFTPSWLPAYALAGTVAQDYPRFLRGEVTGEEVLFSPARLRLWVDFFSNENGLYAVNNQVGAVAVEEWAPRGNGVVLELGGGLGSGTVALLDRLRARGRLAEIRRYRFTEMVPAFLRRGERTLRARFPDASFLTAEQMDMNSPLEAQGVSRGSVSLVYAVNALHVAHDLDFALREILAALQPGGRLVISECVRPVPDWPIYAEFVFNLMETFRAPRLDPRYRPNGGFLTPEQWREAMTAAGFTDIRFLPDVPALRMRFPDFNVGAIGATRPAP